jgi:hypothetical protein
VGGEWREVKTLALGVVEKPVEEHGELVIHTRELSYFSRMSDARTFERQALVEIFERGVEKAGRVCMVADGADWIQAFADLHRADAVRILDLPHAKERVSDVGDAIAEQGLVLELLASEEVCKLTKEDPVQQRKQVQEAQVSAPNQRTQNGRSYGCHCRDRKALHRYAGTWESEGCRNYQPKPQLPQGTSQHDHLCCVSDAWLSNWQRIGRECE